MPHFAARLWAQSTSIFVWSKFAGLAGPNLTVFSLPSAKLGVEYPEHWSQQLLTSTGCAHGERISYHFP
jgi:hypothetical protein